jgi:hypothetical protein
VRIDIGVELPYDNEVAQDDHRRYPTPAGGEDIDKVTRLTYLDTARGLVTRQDPKQSLCFTRTSNGRRAGKEFLARLQEWINERDKAISWSSSEGEG